MSSSRTLATVQDVMGLSRSSRLTRHEDFARLYEQGRKYVHPLAVFFFMPSTTGEVQVGLTASKRTGNAVIRNRIKRRLREVIRHKLPELPAIELVVVARTGLAQASYAQFEEAVSRFVCWLRSRKA